MRLISIVWFVAMAAMWTLAYLIDGLSVHFSLLLVKLFFVADGVFFLIVGLLSLLPRSLIIKNKPLSKGFLGEDRTW